MVHQLADKISSARKSPAAEVECIQLGAVYLGDIYHADRALSSATMTLAFIKEDARTWTEAQYRSHRLRCFFEPAVGGGKGYAVKKGYNLAVDRIISADFGGINHPRNFALMASRLDDYFDADETKTEKLTLFHAHVRKRVIDFARAANGATPAELATWLADLEPLAGGNKTIVEGAVALAVGGAGAAPAPGGARAGASTAGKAVAPPAARK